MSLLMFGYYSEHPALLTFNYAACLMPVICNALIISLLELAYEKQGAKNSRFFN